MLDVVVGGEQFQGLRRIRLTVDADHRDFSDAEFTGGENDTVSGEDRVVLGDDYVPVEAVVLD